MEEDVAVLLTVQRQRAAMGYDGGLVEEAVDVVAEKDLLDMRCLVWKQLQGPVGAESLAGDVYDGADDVRQEAIGVGLQDGSALIGADAIGGLMLQPRKLAPLG